MPNDYFQFKEFLVRQDKCAMKVCTDACLFGAFAAERIKKSKLKIKNVLDIGTGTGLLSLMFAQKNPDVFIDTVEIDDDSFKQAKENVEVSSFKERICVYNDSIQNFASSTQKKYDVVICNPPFYENDLKSANQQRNIALHDDALSLEELISIVDVLLEIDGNFFVLLPYHRTNYFESLIMKHEFFAKEKVSIKQTSMHNYFRTMFWVDRNASASIQSEIIIINEKKEYSDPFNEILKDFYLNL